jgi:hypothetical protein
VPFQGLPVRWKLAVAQLDAARPEFIDTHLQSRP